MQKNTFTIMIMIIMIMINDNKYYYRTKKREKILSIGYSESFFTV